MNMEVFSSLQDAALQRQAEPIVAYIRDNFKEAEFCPILGWIVEKVEDDDFIISIYDQLEALGQDLHFFFDSRYNYIFLPIVAAIELNRVRIVEKICDFVFNWSIYVCDRYQWIHIACRFKSMNIVYSYLNKRGTDFLNDPYDLEVILSEDFVELMDFCLKNGMDRNIKLPDGRDLYFGAVSEEMRRLLDDRTGPISLP